MSTCRRYRLFLVNLNKSMLILNKVIKIIFTKFSIKLVHRAVIIISTKTQHFFYYTTVMKKSKYLLLRHTTMSNLCISSLHRRFCIANYNSTWGISHKLSHFSLFPWKQEISVLSWEQGNLRCRFTCDRKMFILPVCDNKCKI